MAKSDRRERFERDGHLVLPGFAAAEACDALRARMAELVAAFEPAGVATVFSTTRKSHAQDRYFLEPLPTDGLVPLEAEKGTLVALNGLLPHWSGPNRSPASRHAYALHVIDGTAHYSPDNWLRRAPDMPLRGF